MKKIIVSMVASLMIASMPAHAAAKGLGGELTAGKAEHNWGGELGVGYGLTLGPVTVTPIAGAFLYRGDNNRYYQDNFANGQSRCRDSTNGLFANDSKCNNVAASFYAKIEAAVSIASLAEVGVGARYSREKVRPYGLIAVPVAPKIKVAAQIGDRYFSAGFRVGF